MKGAFLSCFNAYIFKHTMQLFNHNLNDFGLLVTDKMFNAKARTYNSLDDDSNL